MSKLYFATEARFVKRNGVYYSLGGFTQTLWDRYLEHFDFLIVIARVSHDESALVNDTMKASGARISFIELPYYIGFGGYLRQKMTIRSKLNRLLLNDGVYICRLPGIIGGEVIDVLNKKGISYACEVVGNPWDVFASGSVNHPCRPILRRVGAYQMRRQLRMASAALYVTQRTLQVIYPVKKGAFSVGVSDVIVKEMNMAQTAKILTDKESYRLISVGSLAQLYKAPDVLLKALKKVSDSGINFDFVWLGDGNYREQMQQLANSLSIADKVHFIGSVSTERVITYLRESDIFLLVSRTEGLPRAVVEAMAQGLPCIGSKVGGIPELLQPDVLVEKDNIEELAILIKKMLTDHTFTNLQAERNINEAQMYKESVLTEKRNTFYKEISNK